MNNSRENNPIYIIGDIHGAFGRLKNLVWHKNLRDCTIICVGDLGVGFCTKYENNVRECDILNQFFAKLNIVFMSIRGNHDDPIFFNHPEKRIDLDNFKLLPDYHTETLNGEQFLFVGGAISIDRIMRIPNISYWNDEAFVLDENKVSKCDVLITHSAPTWIGPYDKSGIGSWIQNDHTLWDDCVKERKDHSRLIELCKPKKSYHGHFHCSSWVDEAGCFSTILDIEEIKEHRSNYEQIKC